MSQEDDAALSGAPLEGGCTCRHVRYRLNSGPLFVNCCHCRWCQRETGSAFVINAMIESERVTLLQGAVDLVKTPSHSGKGQKVARCPHCHVALWSHYPTFDTAVSFVRVGTLDDPDALPPQAHIFTESRQAWVQLPAGIPAAPEFYNPRETWPPETLARIAVLRARMAPSTT